MPKFIMTPLVDDQVDDITARLGAGSGPANQITDAEDLKPVKLVGDSRYDLCAVDNEIEGFVLAVEASTYDGFSLGTVRRTGRFWVRVEGTTLVVGDYVVAGTPTAKGTPVTAAAPARVKKAPGAGATLVFPWRVISLGAAGTGVANSIVLIERK